MVQRMILADDLDGSIDAVETVTFNLDGVTYEIDLSERNAASLRDSLAAYVGAARRATSHPRKADPATIRRLAQDLFRQGVRHDAKLPDRTKKETVPEPADTHRRCDNPECLEVLTWAEGRGRPKRFCTDRCRQRFIAHRRRLTDEATALTNQIESGVTFRQERQLMSELSHAEWLLSAYPQPLPDADTT